MHNLAHFMLSRFTDARRIPLVAGPMQVVEVSGGPVLSDLRRKDWGCVGF